LRGKINDFTQIEGLCKKKMGRWEDEKIGEVDSYISVVAS
jgi:hypothetical protein